MSNNTLFNLPLLRITSHYFCAGIEIGGRAAPILRYMKHWPAKKIINYCYKKGWRYVWIND